jgi:uncharacterized membrane protein
VKSDPPENRSTEWRIVRGLRADPWALRLIPAVSVYVVVWSYMTILKFYALQATVFDLGVETEVLWGFVHPQHVTALSYVATVVLQPVQFLLSPISIPLSFPFVLFVQTAGLASGAFAVYGIARRVLGRAVDAYCLALVYLLYFPMGGVNWFDFHAQAFFIPLFLWGFLCYLSRRYKLACVLFLLAAGTTYSYVLLVVLFSAVTVAELFARRVRLGEKTEPREWRFSLVLLGASTAFFVYQFLVYTYLIGVSFSQNAGVVAGTLPILNRMGVVGLLLLPVLFLPVLSPKWLVMLAPFFFLEFTSSSTVYSYPAIFQLQYTALAIPFVLIGAIYGIRTVRRWSAQRAAPTLASNPQTPPTRRLVHRHRHVVSLATVVLAVTIGCATLLQPYGPFNACCADSFAAPTASIVNWTYYDQYSHIVSLIPAGNPYVRCENNMPSVLPRPLEYSGAPFVPGIVHWVNATGADAALNEFPLRVEPGRVSNVPIDYALADPNTLWYTWGGNVSMFTFFTSLYQSDDYGLEAEASGMTLLARGYSGPLEYYEPLDKVIPSTQLYSGETHSLSKGSFLSASDLTGQPAWYGPYAPFSPGTYRVTYSVRTSSLVPQDQLSLLVLAHNATVQLANESLTSQSFGAPDVWTTISQTVRFSTAYPDVEFAAWYANWTGTLCIRSISVSEIVPPSPVFEGQNSPGTI